MSPMYQRYLLVALLAATLFSPLAAITFGTIDLSFQQVLQALWQSLINGGTQDITQRVVVELRLPRVFLALLCGIGLSLSGTVLQSVTRNPLADPFLFGISAGASLGAVLAITGGVDGLGITAAAFLGAMAAILIIMVMAQNGEIERLILAGVAISFLFASCANLLLYFSDSTAMRSVLFWSLGSFARASWQGLLIPTLVIVVALLIVQLWQRHLYAMQAGDESAHTQGVAVVPLRLAMLLVTAIVTASIVAQCGSIGFVGLMVPHISRLLFGAGGSHSILFCSLLGGVFMVWVDVVAHQLLPQQELPVGVITAILGSTFFISMLFTRSNR